MSNYSTAVSRIVLDASGVYLEDGASLVTGTVTLNAVNGSLRSITVTNPATRKAVVRVKGAALRTTALSFATKRDDATFQGFTR